MREKVGSKMPLLRPLPNFALNEFQHPELIEQDAANFLQEVRTQFGEALTVTDDARLPDERPSGAARGVSWHQRGRAFDLRCRDWSWRKLWRFVEAVFMVAANWRGRATVELELVWSATDKHVHLAVKNDGTPSELILALD
mgnify:FL=1